MVDLKRLDEVGDKKNSNKDTLHCGRKPDEVGDKKAVTKMHCIVVEKELETIAKTHIQVCESKTSSTVVKHVSLN